MFTRKPAASSNKFHFYKILKRFSLVLSAEPPVQAILAFDDIFSQQKFPEHLLLSYAKQEPFPIGVQLN